jgi:hypothetical protein
VLMLGSITGVTLLVTIAPRRRLGLTLMGTGTLGAVLVLPRRTQAGHEFRLACLVHIWCSGVGRRPPLPQKT